MFAINEGYKWSAANFPNLHGAVFLASGNDIVRMSRAPQGNLTWKIFDPQLYLAGLDSDKSVNVCARLVGYPWFGIDDVPTFNSSVQGKTEWRKDMKGFVTDNWLGCTPDDKSLPMCAAAAIAFQADRGCTHILAPTPLISQREDEGETCGTWLDASVEASEELGIGQPLIATVAISEGVLNDSSFEVGGFLDTVVDQVTSREGLGGVYIVVDQTQKVHPLCTPANVTRAYGHLTRAFASFGYEFVFVNFADVFGVACLGLGATGFATGRSQSLRRLCIASMAEDSPGLPLPRLYSHPCVAEFLSEREMEQIARRKLLSVVRDLTPFSQDLFKALSDGRDVTALPRWAESKNNVDEATRHFITRMILEGEGYANLSVDDRLEKVENWLKLARKKQKELDLESSKHWRTTTPVYAPVKEWSQIVDEYSDR